MADITLAARKRESTGKGAARRLRNNNEIPAVFYGPKTEPILLAVDYPELEKMLRESATENVIFDLMIKGKKGRAAKKKAFLKEVQIDPVKRNYLHADFYEISMKDEITVEVPIHLINTPVGVKEGGILQQIRRELSITCLPDKLMDYLEVDVSDLNIGDSIHISDIELPEGASTDEEEHLAVATVAAPTAEPVEEEEEEEELEEEAAEEEPVEE